jgi:ADP-ribose pyrophosphatase
MTRAVPVDEGPAGEDEASRRGKPGRIDRQEIWGGRVVRLSLDTVRFPGGGTGKLELVTHPGASAILPFLDPPIDPDPRIVLIRQYRYAAGGEIYEVPAGIPDSPDESWEACAYRELREETGYEARRLQYLGRIFTTPGFTDEVIHLFAAMELAAGPVDPDGDEFIEVVTLPLSEALGKVERGEIEDAKSLCALFLAASFARDRWLTARTAPER